MLLLKNIRLNPTLVKCLVVPPWSYSSAAYSVYITACVAVHHQEENQRIIFGSILTYYCKIPVFLCFGLMS